MSAHESMEHAEHAEHASGSNKKIAHEFGISVRTVEMHRSHIMSKLGVRSLAEAALLATQAGIDLGGGWPVTVRPHTNGLHQERLVQAEAGAIPGPLARRVGN